MMEQKINWLCIGFFSYSQLGKRGFAHLYYKGFLDNFQNQNPPTFSIEQSTTNMSSSRSKCGMGTFRGSNSTKHHGKHFSNHTLMFIYQELKIKKRVKKDKHHTKHKI
jgi:hypothetical protein